MKNVFELKSGINKGNRRIWVEGRRLAEAGFAKGDRLSKSIEGRRLTLTKTSDPSEAKHRIAGTPDRPILDLCGKWVTKFIDGSDCFRVTLENETITIQPCS